MAALYRDAATEEGADTGGMLSDEKIHAGFAELHETITQAARNNDVYRDVIPGVFFGQDVSGGHQISGLISVNGGDEQARLQLSAFRRAALLHAFDQETFAPLEASGGRIPVS